MTKKRPVLKLFLVGGFVFCVDFITKWLTHSYLPLIYTTDLSFPYGGIGIFKTFWGIQFSINHATNLGAAWGMFADFHFILLLIRIGIISGLLLYIFFFNRNRLFDFPLILITFGALGNIFDSFYYGHVIDMLYFQFGQYSFPIFNVADTCIFLGIVSLSILCLFHKRDKIDHDSIESFHKK